MSNSPSELSLTSRDADHIRSKKNGSRQTQKQKKAKNPTKTDVPESTSKTEEDQAKMLTEDILEESNQDVHSNKPCKYNPTILPSCWR